jgi:hypothetical protein
MIGGERVIARSIYISGRDGTRVRKSTAAVGHMARASDSCRLIRDSWNVYSYPVCWEPRARWRWRVTFGYTSVFTPRALSVIPSGALFTPPRFQLYTLQGTDTDHASSLPLSPTRVLFPLFVASRRSFIRSSQKTKLCRVLLPTSGICKDRCICLCILDQLILSLQRCTPSTSDDFHVTFESSLLLVP